MDKKIAEKKNVGRPTKRPSAQNLREEYKVLTQPEMAVKYGVSIRTVARWLDQMGIKKEPA